MQENRSFDSYFGTFPGADGFPTTRTATSACACRTPQRRLHRPVPRPAGPQRRRTARSRGCHGRHQRRGDGRVRRPVRERRATRQHGCKDPNAPACSVGARATSWATTTAARSRTTGPTRRTSSSRTTCSSRTPRGACRRTCSPSRAGRPSARTRTPSPAATTTPGPATRGRSTELDPRVTAAARRCTRGPTSPT